MQTDPERTIVPDGVSSGPVSEALYSSNST